MSEQERVLLVGGDRDGTWHEVAPDAETIAFGEALAADASPGLAERLSSRVIYERCRLSLSDGETVSVFRVSTLTDLQAVNWLLAFYAMPRNRGESV